MHSGMLLDGRYRLLSQLGAGGMSVVWLAHDERLGRDVAVKVMNGAAASDPRLRERLHAEARTAARLNHAHVVDVRDFGESPDGEPFVVMERLRGESLVSVLTGAPLPWPFAVRVTAELATALAAAHRQGIVHRDISPSNVILSPDGVKLVDFGISARTGDPDAGPDDIVMGTPAYLAPERLERASVNPAGDVYALGVLLYRLLAGRLPWDAETVVDLLNAHYCEEPTPLPHIAGLPTMVRDLCHQCLAKDPAARPDATTLARMFSGVTPATETTTVLPRPLSLRARSRRPSRIRAVAAVIVALAVLGTAMTAGFGRSDPGLPPADASVSGLGGNPVACEVRYDLRSRTAGRFSSAITVSNAGTADVTGWQLEFDLPEQQQIVRPWNGNMHQSGPTVLVTGAVLTPGVAVSTGFEGESVDGHLFPAAFRVNGALCESTFTATESSGPAGDHRTSGGGTGVVAGAALVAGDAAPPRRPADPKGRHCGRAISEACPGRGRGLQPPPMDALTGGIAAVRGTVSGIHRWVRS